MFSNANDFAAKQREKLLAYITNISCFINYSKLYISKQYMRYYFRFLNFGNDIFKATIIFVKKVPEGPNFPFKRISSCF